MNLFIILPVLFFSAIIHECAHGWAAERCGDETARLSGRITLNPLPHIDIFGTIILPLLLVLFHSSVFFAYAKPVPINPYNFRDYKKGIMLVSTAGPLSNFLLAVLASVFLYLLRFIAPGITYEHFLPQILYYFVEINVALGVLNLIPIPPIDGSKILLAMLPMNIATRIEIFGQRFGFFLIFFLLTTSFFTRFIWTLTDVIVQLLLAGIR